MSGINAEKFIENWYGEPIPKGWCNDYESLQNLSITELKQMLNEFAEQKANGATTGGKQCNLPDVMPRIYHFIDENGTTVDLNAEGVNVRLKRDGTHEYFRSFGFAGRKELTPVYGA